MMPVLMVMPGIMPTTSPRKDPMAVAKRLVGKLAWASPCKTSLLIRATLGIFPAEATRQICV